MTTRRPPQDPPEEDRTILAVPRNAPQPPDEWELIRRAQQGERPCFEELYRRHVGRVYGLCLRLSRRAEEAEEMTQEVFVRAWQNLDRLEPHGRFTGWLHRVAVNLYLNERRTVARRGVPAELPGDDQLAGPRDASAGTRMDLEEAIAALPDKSRAVYVLHSIHGYNHKELSEMTGMAVGTTKTHVHRARMRLRKRLSR
jgi:RNA polymerase sigma-70 factor (ECF subfamily)